MELSGLIFVALALVWAVVLIPKALRHHDEVARTRSVADVSDEGRVVARRTGATAAPAASAEGRLPAAPKPAPQTSPTKKSRAPRTSGARGSGTPSRGATAPAAARRRRILAVLLVADLGVGAAALVGVLASWAPVVPLVLTVAFLVVARITVRRDQARRQARLAAQRRRAMQPVQPLVEPSPAMVEPFDGAQEPPASEASRVETTVPGGTTNEQGFNVISGLDDTSSIPVVRLAGDGSDSLWDPLPVTLPTYVTKPRASRSVRTIDLSAPDVSSSGRSSAASALVAEAATAAATTTGKGDSARAVGS